MNLMTVNGIMTEQPVVNEPQKIKNLDTFLQWDTQYRRELSISYFNSLNNAINLVIASTTKSTKVETKLALIKEVRNKFLEEYKQYRVDVLDGFKNSSMIDPKIQEGLDKARIAYEKISH